MDGKLRDDVTSPRLSFDAAIELLANRRRRHALDVLARTPDGVADLDAVAERVCEREPGADDERTVRTTLHHVHLPRLADENVIAYDPGRGRIRYHGSPRLERLVEAVDSGEHAPA